MNSISVAAVCIYNMFVIGISVGAALFVFDRTGSVHSFWLLLILLTTADYKKIEGKAKCESKRDAQ